MAKKKPKPFARKYTDEQRAKFLAALDANGRNYLRTAKMLGIPLQTLRDIDRKQRDRLEKTGVVAKERHELAADLEVLAGNILSVLTKDKLRSANPQQLLISLGITFDKLALLKGGLDNMARKEEPELSPDEFAERLKGWLRDCLSRQRYAENQQRMRDGLQPVDHAALDKAVDAAVATVEAEYLKERPIIRETGDSPPSVWEEKPAEKPAEEPAYQDSYAGIEAPDDEPETPTPPEPPKKQPGLPLKPNVPWGYPRGGYGRRFGPSSVN